MRRLLAVFVLMVGLHVLLQAFQVHSAQDAHFSINLLTGLVLTAGGFLSICLGIVLFLQNSDKSTV